MNQAVELLKNVIRFVCPGGLLRLYGELTFGGNRYLGNYDSFAAARHACSGYDSELIIQKVTDATREVLAGHAVFERDSVLFYQEEYNWPLVAALLSIAAERQNRLTVLDFGGSLGSTFWQNRKLLSHLHEINWCIIEQPKFVAAGKQLLPGGPIQFYPSLAEFYQTRSADVVLFSSVLQYLEQPYEIIAQAVRQQPPHIILDRLAVIDGDHDRLSRQIVDRSIYPGSYPAWFFVEKNILNAFAGYEIVARYPALTKDFHIESPAANASDNGYWLKKKS